MKLEYLYFDDSYKSKIATLDLNSNIRKIERDVDNLHFFAFELNGDKEQNCRIMCNLKVQVEALLESDKLFLLTNDAGEYINKRLFPLFNKFERLLRKILFLISIKNNNNNALEVAKIIEQSDFGQIYDKVFTSDDFKKQVKSVINNKVFTKYEIINELQKIEEDTVWSNLFSNQYTYISNNFPLIKEYRNATMHAHNLTYSEYLEAKDIIEKSIKELQEIIVDCESNTLNISEESSIQLNGAFLALGLLVNALGETVKDVVHESVVSYLSERMKNNNE